MPSDNVIYFGIAWLAVAIVIGFWADNKVIGFFPAMLISLLLSPLVAIIFVATSKDRRTAILERKALRQMASTTGTADEIQKLVNLRDSGEISQDEFEALKAKLVN